MDPTRATFVSVVPRPIALVMPHINPSYYNVPAAKNGVEILIIEEATHFVYMGEGKQLQQTTPAYQVAEALVQQYISGQLSLSEGSAPGVFWVAGALTKEEVKKKHAAEIDLAYKNQRGWFTRLVMDADDVWSKFRQHKFISDLQRDACKALGWEREWLTVTPEGNAVKCPACKSTLVDPEALVCAVCRTVVNVEKFKAAGLQVVGG